MKLKSMKSLLASRCSLSVFVYDSSRFTCCHFKLLLAPSFLLCIKNLISHRQMKSRPAFNCFLFQNVCTVPGDNGELDMNRFLSPTIQVYHNEPINFRMFRRAMPSVLKASSAPATAVLSGWSNTANFLYTRLTSSLEHPGTKPICW